MYPKLSMHKHSLSYTSSKIQHSNVFCPHKPQNVHYIPPTSWNSIQDNSVRNNSRFKDTQRYMNTISSSMGYSQLEKPISKSFLNNQPSQEVHARQKLNQTTLSSQVKPKIFFKPFIQPKKIVSTNFQVSKNQTSQNQHQKMFEPIKTKNVENLDITRSVIRSDKKQSENDEIKTKRRGQSIRSLKKKVGSYLTLLKKMESNESTNATNEISSPQNSPKKSFSSTGFGPSFIYNSKKIKKTTLSDFLPLKKLGQGKYGELYAALHKKTGAIFALKKLKKQSIVKENMIERVILEVKLQSYINHPNIVKLYGIFDDKENIYMILELMQQGSLFDKMMKNDYHKDSVKILNQNNISTIIKETLCGLSQLHSKSIIHRDIKPQNIVLSYGVSKLCDLGWSAFTKKSHQRRNTSCGTFDYVPPQILKGQQYGQSVDLWELGVLSFELATGRLPFYHQSRKQTYLAILNYKNQLKFSNSVSYILQDFIQCLVQKKAQQRIPAHLMLKHPFIQIHQTK